MGGKSSSNKTGVRLSTSSYKISKVGESEAKHGVLGENKTSEASTNVNVDDIFKGTPPNLQSTVETFKKRNGSEIDSSETNIKKIARIVTKMAKDIDPNSVEQGSPKTGEGKGTWWDANTRQGIRDILSGDEAGNIQMGDNEMAVVPDPNSPTKGTIRPIDNNEPATTLGLQNLPKEQTGKVEEKRAENAAQKAKKRGGGVWNWLFGSTEDKLLQAAESKNEESQLGNGFDWIKYQDEIEDLNKIEGKVGWWIDAESEQPPVSSGDGRMEIELEFANSFFSDPTPFSFGMDENKIDYNNLQKTDQDGNWTVYDAENKDFPNAYPDAEQDMTNFMAKMGLSPEVIIDVGQKTEEKTIGLHRYGRELLLSMSEMSPGFLKDMKGVYFVTRDQFDKAADENSPSHDIHVDGLPEGTPAFIHNNRLVVFIDDIGIDEKTGKTEPSVEAMKTMFQHELARFQIHAMPPSFLDEWRNASMFSEQPNGMWTIDTKRNNIEQPQALEILKKAFNDDYLSQYANAEGGIHCPAEEIAEAMRMYKHPRLPWILATLKRDNKPAYDYLSRMMAVVNRYEKNLTGLTQKKPIEPRKITMPSVTKMAPGKARSLSTNTQDALEKMAEGIVEKESKEMVPETVAPTQPKDTPPKPTKKPKMPKEIKPKEEPKKRKTTPIDELDLEELLGPSIDQYATLPSPKENQGKYNIFISKNGGKECRAITGQK